MRWTQHCRGGSACGRNLDQGGGNRTEHDDEEHSHHGRRYGEPSKVRRVARLLERSAQDHESKLAKGKQVVAHSCDVCHNVCLHPVDLALCTYEMIRRQRGRENRKITSNDTKQMRPGTKAMSS